MGTKSFPRVSGDEPLSGAGATSTTRFPRVSGDEPFKNTLSFAGVAFSPRERG